MIVAIAIDEQRRVNPIHFGDAVGFVLYSLSGIRCEHIGDISNGLLNYDEDHGSPEKGKMIVKILKDNNVAVVASKQFGQNIRIVSKSFLPVVTRFNNPDDFVKALIDSYETINSRLEAENFKPLRV